MRAGADLGSRTVKVVLVKDHQLLFAQKADTSPMAEQTAGELLKNACLSMGMEQTNIPLLATGYGRRQMSAAIKALPEITCQARGVHFFLPHVRTVIDVGGQDTKAILLDERGLAEDFVMNDKCAAGSGRFAERAATLLGCDLATMGNWPVPKTPLHHLSSTCVVFAESEIISLRATGIAPQEMAAAVFSSLARQIKNLLGRINHRPPYAFTGGGACLPGLVLALQQELGEMLLLPPQPLFTAAVGAAVSTP